MGAAGQLLSGGTSGHRQGGREARLCNGLEKDQQSEAFVCCDSRLALSISGCKQALPSFHSNTIMTRPLCGLIHFVTSLTFTNELLSHYYYYFP